MWREKNNGEEEDPKELLSPNPPNSEKGEGLG